MSIHDCKFARKKQLMTADLAVAANDDHELGGGEQPITMDLVAEGTYYHGSGDGSD